MKNSIFEDVIDVINKRLQLTDDILNNTVQITVLGARGICIENYRRVKTFNSEIIIIDSKSGEVVIKGEKLFIDILSEEEIFIRGKVLEINLGNLGEIL